MTEAAVFEAKNRLPYYIHLVEAGETVQITRHGKPVARIVAEKECEQKSEGQVFMEKVMAWREKNRDWLTNEVIDETFTLPRSLEPFIRHPEDIAFGE